MEDVNVICIYSGMEDKMTEQMLLRRNIVERRTGLARSTIYSMMKAGTFPLPIRVGKRAVRWREADIRDFVESKGGWTINKALAKSLHVNSYNSPMEE